MSSKHAGRFDKDTLARLSDNEIREFYLRYFDSEGKYQTRDGEVDGLSLFFMWASYATVAGITLAAFLVDAFVPFPLAWFIAACLALLPALLAILLSVVNISALISGIRYSKQSYLQISAEMKRRGLK